MPIQLQFGLILSITYIFIDLGNSEIRLYAPPVTYNMTMRKVLNVLLILGFLAVDFLFFHDFFKAGEVITVPQYLTGLLSLPVMAASAKSLLYPATRLSSR